MQNELTVLKPLGMGAETGLARGAPAAGVLELTRGLAAGDEAAYRRFFDEYLDRLTRYLLVVSRGNEQATRDALPLLLDRVVKHVRAFPSEEVFWSWLTVLARSALVDETRKRGRYFGFLAKYRDLRSEISDLRESAFAEPAADCGDGLDEALESALGDLPPQEREMVEAKYLRRETVQQIAVADGMTEKAVESRLTRIRRKLKASILERMKHETEIR